MIGKGKGKGRKREGNIIELYRKHSMENEGDRRDEYKQVHSNAVQCSTGEGGKGQGKGNRRALSLTPSISRPPSPLLRVLHTPLHCLRNALEGTVLNLIKLCG